MPGWTRSAPAAFGRGVSQVVANPGLLLAPVVFATGVAAALVVAGACAVLLAGGVIASRVAALRRGPAAFSDFFEGLQGFLLASPVAVLLFLLGVLVALLLLTALAAWIRAGVTGSLAEIDARAAEGAPLSEFRHPSLGRTFLASAGRLFGGFFALVNLYALVASFVALLIVVPAAGALAALAAGRYALMVLCGLVFAALVLVAIVVSAALRVVYLVAGRILAAEGPGALTATGRAIAFVKQSPGRPATLYLLTVGGAMLVGLAFAVPRLVLTFAAGFTRVGFWAPLVVSAAFLLLQVAAGLAYDLVVTGSFVALRPVETAPAGPGGAPEAPTP